MYLYETVESMIVNIAFVLPQPQLHLNSYVVFVLMSYQAVSACCILRQFSIGSSSTDTGRSTFTKTLCSGP